MEQQESTQQTASMGERIMNVFSSPTEAFEGFASIEPKSAFWLPPLLIALILTMSLSFVVASNPTIKDQIIEMQKKKIQEQVDKGGILQENADRQVDAMENIGSMFAVFGSIAAGFMILVYFLGGSLFLWIAGKIALNSTRGFSTFLSLYGLSAWILILGSVIGSLMILGLGSLYATPTAALAVYPDFDSMNSTHIALAKIDLFALWQAVIIGFGLSKISEKPAGTGIGLALALYAVWAVLGILLGLTF